MREPVGRVEITQFVFSRSSFEMPASGFLSTSILNLNRVSQRNSNSKTKKRKKKADEMSDLNCEKLKPGCSEASMPCKGFNL
jgi:hypothetical protein